MTEMLERGSAITARVEIFGRQRGYDRRAGVP